MRWTASSGKPSAPSGRVRARRSGDSVVVEWDAPADDGGARVTSFVVEYKSADALYWARAAVVDALTRSVAVHGLRRADDCAFRVAAVNEMGAGEPLETDVTAGPAAASTTATAAAAAGS